MRSYWPHRQANTSLLVLDASVRAAAPKAPPRGAWNPPQSLSRDHMSRLRMRLPPTREMKLFVQ